jgi:acetyl esterase/lipase
MSPVSDTTIASSGTQGADIGGTVRARVKYALPAGLAALAVSVWLGGDSAAAVAASAASTMADGSSAVASSAAASTQAALPLVMLAVPVLVIAMLLAKRHLIESLLGGIVTATVLALAFGLLAPSELLRVEPNSYSATGVILDGFNRAIGVSVFTLLLMALVGTIQATDLLERLIAAVERRAKSARGAEAWIVGAVSGAVMLTTHSIVAVLMTGRFAKETGERHGIGAYRRANLLDLTVCTWPFLLPWFLPPILAAGSTRDFEALGMPAVSPLAAGLYNTYAWALVLIIAVAVITGYGRRGSEASAVATASPSPGAPTVALLLLGGAVVGLAPTALAAQAGGVPFSAVADSARRAHPADVRLTYGSAPSQFAELRLPAGRGPHPTVLLLHGGCWLSAYGVDHVAGIAESLRQSGFAVFAAEYRRVGEEGAGVPGTFDDVRAAYDSLRAIAPRYSLDTARVLLMGHSAGGHLALWLASEAGVRVRGVIGLAAVTSLEEFAAPSGCGSAVPRLMGGARDADDELSVVRYAAASPVARAGAPQGTTVLLVVSDADRVVPITQAQAYLTRFPRTESLQVSGGHFDLVAPWTSAWARVRARLLQLAR